jgi:hypothetical protein
MKLVVCCSDDSGSKWLEISKKGTVTIQDSSSKKARPVFLGTVSGFVLNENGRRVVSVSQIYEGNKKETAKLRGALFNNLRLDSRLISAKINNKIQYAYFEE